MKRKKRTFQELVIENRLALLRDEKQLAKIEERIDNRHVQNLNRFTI